MTFDDVNENINRLVRISFEGLLDNVSISIGKFSGRGETNYKVNRENSACFLFAVNGAFEVEGRLLHSRDGLALWDTNAIEMEALKQ